MKFKKDFIWGVSTAAYQVEGGAYEDGKGVCNWDLFSQRRDKCKHSGDVACDHYHRWEEDIEYMKELGVNAYRFSLNWARILPKGIGEVNMAGIAFYNKIIDKCLSYGIIPYVTLFHFDYPMELENKGGWKHPDSPYWFEEYAKVAVKYFGDRVKNWFTMNETNNFLQCGYWGTMFPPAEKLGNEDLIPMAHHILLGHGLAAKVIHAAGGKVGFVADTALGIIPATTRTEDVEYARRKYFEVDSERWFSSITWWCDPVYLGKYPQMEELWAYLPEGWQEDMKTISEPLDFFALNSYSSSKVEYTPECEEMKFIPNPNSIAYPEVLYWIPKFVYERYHLPVFITENGYGNASAEWVCMDGKVHDGMRCDYLYRFLGQLERAAADGVDIMGYMHWTFMDNLEWAAGFTRRFGLIYVDFETLERTPKDSFYVYRDIIKENDCQSIKKSEY